MRLYYDNSTGKIFYVVKDVDLFYFTHTTNIALSELDIDEVSPDNKTICIDLRQTVGKVDSEGDGKYKVINGEVHEKEGWQEDIDVI